MKAIEYFVRKMVAAWVSTEGNVECDECPLKKLCDNYSDDTDCVDVVLEHMDEEVGE